MKRIMVLTAFLVLGMVLSIYAQGAMAPMPLAEYPAVDKPEAEFLQSVSFDQYGRGDAPTNKFSNGVVNLATCWTDIPMRSTQIAEEQGAVEGWTLGLGAGIFEGAARAVVGTVQTATFILPPYDEPLIEPNFSVVDPEKDGYKITLLEW